VSGLQEMSIDPKEPILADGNAQLIRKTWAIKLLGELLGSWILLALPGAAVDAIHPHVEDYVIIIKVTYVNLQQTKLVTVLVGFFHLVLFRTHLIQF
jgi:hypothetical protein